jgi:hypothetical protein
MRLWCSGSWGLHYCATSSELLKLWLKLLVSSQFWMFTPPMSLKNREEKMACRRERSPWHSDSLRPLSPTAPGSPFLSLSRPGCFVLRLHQLQQLLCSQLEAETWAALASLIRGWACASEPGWRKLLWRPASCGSSLGLHFPAGPAAISVTRGVAEAWER